MTPVTVEQLAGVLLIVVPVAFNGAFFALARAFDYPDILRREPDEILRRFAAGGPGLLLRWELLLLSALAMLPLAAVLAVALAAPPALSALAVVLGASAALVQALGLVRWPYGVAELARRYVAAPAGPSGDATREAVVVTFATLHRLLGVGVGRAPRLPADRALDAGRGCLDRRHVGHSRVDGVHRDPDRRRDPRRRPRVRRSQRAGRMGARRRGGAHRVHRVVGVAHRARDPDADLTVEVTKPAVEDAIRRIDPAGVASARWFGGKGRAIRSIELAEAFVLPGDGRHVLAVANVVYERGPAEAYLFPLVADAGVLRPAAEGDGTLRALAGAIAEGRTIPALPSDPDACCGTGPGWPGHGGARVPSGVGPARPGTRRGCPR